MLAFALKNFGFIHSVQFSTAPQSPFGEPAINSFHTIFCPHYIFIIRINIFCHLLFWWNQERSRENEYILFHFVLIIILRCSQEWINSMPLLTLYHKNEICNSYKTLPGISLELFCAQDKNGVERRQGGCTLKCYIWFTHFYKMTWCLRDKAEGINKWNMI